jgi:hypothetical protein
MTGLRRTRPLRSLYCLCLCLYLYFRRIAPPFQKSRAARSVLCALRSHYPPFSHLPITVGASLELRSSLPVCPVSILEASLRFTIREPCSGFPLVLTRATRELSTLRALLRVIHGAPH